MKSWANVHIGGATYGVGLILATAARPGIMRKPGITLVRLGGRLGAIRVVANRTAGQA